jgi:hypothetical protein
MIAFNSRGHLNFRNKEETAFLILAFTPSQEAHKMKA